ncbi:MAG: hypothetical protein V7K55_16410 [Nostoc sp.]|uniref:hypothetical protein n=1 Tax=Nostoc sp. TaxID=1180 RepID=UPI002FFCC617
MLPFIFSALGLAVGAVVGAFTTHAVGESDRQAAKHHRTVANELADKYTNLEQKYYELADKTKKQIPNLTDQHALDEVEKDCLRLAVRLQHSLIDLMWDIDRDPTEAALNKFVNAVEFTNNFLYEINEKLICVPSDYYARNLIAAVQFSNLPNINNEESTKKHCQEKTNLLKEAEGAIHLWHSTPPELKPLNENSVGVLNPRSVWSQQKTEGNIPPAFLDKEGILMNNNQDIFLNSFKGLYYFFKVSSTSDFENNILPTAESGFEV